MGASFHELSLDGEQDPESFLDEILRYLNSSDCNKDPSQTQKKHSPFFQLRTIASELEGLEVVRSFPPNAQTRSPQWRMCSSD